jgi:hypothetical protein
VTHCEHPEHLATKRTTPSAKQSFEREFSAMEVSFSMPAGASLIALGCASAMARQVIGVSSSPVPISTGKQLPPPDPKFSGIKETAADPKA